MGNPHVTIDVAALLTKEVNYKGSFRYGVSGIYIWSQFHTLRFHP